MRTIFSLAEKGYAPYFDIRKNKDEYVFLILLPRTGAVRPICKSEKNLRLKTIFNTKMDWCDMSVKEYFNSLEGEQYYCKTLKGKTLWKRIQRAIKEKTK